jgi:hypothetical protein
MESQTLELPIFEQNDSGRMSQEPVIAFDPFSEQSQLLLSYAAECSHAEPLMDAICNRYTEESSKFDASMRVSASEIGRALSEAKSCVKHRMIERLRIRACHLFSPLIKGFQTPEPSPGDFPLIYADSIISTLSGQAKREKLGFSQCLFNWFHPESNRRTHSKPTKRGQLFDIPVYFDDIFEKISFSSQDRVKEIASAISFIGERLDAGPLSESSLALLSEALNRKHVVFKRQSLQLAPYAKVTIFKSSVKFELTFEALEAMQLIWQEFLPTDTF